MLKRKLGFSMRVLFAFSLLLAVAGTSAAAAEPGRYTFVEAENGVFRLDTETGGVSLCMERGGTLVCLRAPALGGAAQARDAGNAALEARVAALETADGEAKAPRHGETLGRVRTLAEHMMDRVVALVREMKDAAL